MPPPTTTSLAGCYLWLATLIGTHANAIRNPRVPTG